MLGFRFSRGLSEALEDQIPRVFYRVTVKEKDDGDRARPVGVPIVTGDEGRNESDCGDRHGEKRHLNRRLLECLQQPGRTRQTGDILKPHGRKLCATPHDRSQTDDQDRYSDGDIERRIWLLNKVGPGEVSDDREKDRRHQQTKHSGRCGLMSSC